MYDRDGGNAVLCGSVNLEVKLKVEMGEERGFTVCSLVEDVGEVIDGEFTGGRGGFLGF